MRLRIAFHRDGTWKSLIRATQMRVSICPSHFVLTRHSTNAWVMIHITPAFLVYSMTMEHSRPRRKLARGGICSDPFTCKTQGIGMYHYLHCLHKGSRASLRVD